MSKIVKKVVKRNPLNALKRKRASDSIEAVQATRRVTAENILGIVEHLKRKDPTLRNVIEVLGPPLSLVSRIKGDAFTSLVKSIVGQQLSSKAAASIFCRVQDQCGGQGAHVVPEKILGAGTEKLRTLGLSGRKVEYVQDLASKFLSGELSNEKLASLSRDEVMEALIKVRGLGEWSVHMFQIFHLGEPDVLPWGDLGVKKGAYALYVASGTKPAKPAKSAAVSREKLEDIARVWKPYRSIGSWYMWRANEYLERVGKEEEEEEE